MKCPSCGYLENKVVDSRTNQSGDLTRRRRECLSCSSRFTTYERIEELLPMVVKKDGRREEFDREKLKKGLKIACRKRPISSQEFDEMLQEIEKDLSSLGTKEVDSRSIGQIVMRTLYKRDKVAYIRFASVYREFKDVNDFLFELQRKTDELSASN
ncbi:MAG: transcriptional regulator NrdR [Oligoflexia bacterium]|nr:transcriptional regulator NrdR [Oligoflexia bacterium]